MGIYSISVEKNFVVFGVNDYSCYTGTKNTALSYKTQTIQTQKIVNEAE